MHRVSFQYARPIAPQLDPPEWPGKRAAPLYWLARKKIELPEAPAAVSLLLTADRHYDLYLNGHCVARQRGFFSGDAYLLAQRWQDEIKAGLRQGSNTLEIVIRSDPWRNKNYRAFYPLLCLELDALCAGRNLRVVSDGSWEAAVIAGWRTQIALSGCGTISYERITLAPESEAMLSGFRRGILLAAVRVLDPALLPPVYLWHEKPVRQTLYPAARLVARGACQRPTTALDFIPADEAPLAGPMILEAVFNSAGHEFFGLAASALRHWQIEFNGKMLAERNQPPGQHQMGLPDYLVPAGQFETISGINRLVITVFAGRFRWFRLAATDRPQLLEAQSWSIKTGQPVKISQTPLELAEQIGAYTATGPAGIAGGGHPLALHVQAGAAFAIVDFGRLTVGRLVLKLRARSAGRIHLAYGFSCENNVVDCQRMNLRAVDTLEAPAGASSYAAFASRTFRYLAFIFEEFTAAVELTDISVEESVYLDEAGTDFTSPEKELNAIWRAARRTAQLCNQEIFVDNTEREYAQWSDAITALAASGYYLGGARLARKAEKALTEMAWTQQADGQLAGYAPGQWFPRLPLQCHMALFAMACHRHYMHTGDEDFGRRMLKVILRMVEHWERHRTAAGLLADLHTVFIDWGSHIYSYGRGSQGPTGVLTALNAYYLGVLRRTAEMAGFLGLSAETRSLNRLAGEVEKAIRTELYDGQRGVFRDGLRNVTAENNISQTANLLAVGFGAAPAGKEKAILESVWLAGANEQIIPANAFFVIQAGETLFSADCAAMAVRWLRRGFGAMLKCGDTLWETWEPHASRCQSTGAAVAYLFARYLAGLYPAEPGYRVIGLDPHPAGLRSLRAVCATPGGEVGVAWEQKADKLECCLRVPPEWQGRPVRPRPGINVALAAASNSAAG